MPPERTQNPKHSFTLYRMPETLLQKSVLTQAPVFPTQPPVIELDPNTEIITEMEDSGHHSESEGDAPALESQGTENSDQLNRPRLVSWIWNHEILSITTFGNTNSALIESILNSTNVPQQHILQTTWSTFTVCPRKIMGKQLQLLPAAANYTRFSEDQHHSVLNCSKGI